MASMTAKMTKKGLKRLEVTMLDVMDGLEDAASFMNYHSTPDVVEILSIEPPGRAKQPQATVLPIKNYTPEPEPQADIVAYLIARETRLSA